MNLSPEDLITSFLEQARERKIAVAVLSAFVRDNKLVRRTNHNLNIGTEKNFMLPFLQVDKTTIEAAARAILRFSVPDASWERMTEEQRGLFTQTAEAVLVAARTAQMSEAIGAVASPPPLS